MTPLKKCPFCAEEIQLEAIKCRHCGEFLTDQRPAVKKERAPWVFSHSAVVLGFLMVGPFILPLVWVNPRYSLQQKWQATAVILLITLLLIWALASVWKSLSQYYDLMRQYM